MSNITNHKIEFTLLCENNHKWVGNFTNLKYYKKNKCNHCKVVNNIKKKLKIVKYKF